MEYALKGDYDMTAGLELMNFDVEIRVQGGPVTPAPFDLPIGTPPGQDNGPEVLDVKVSRGTWDGQTWKLIVRPGEHATLYVVLGNGGPDSITVISNISSPTAAPGLLLKSLSSKVGWSGIGQVIPAGGNTTVPVVLETDENAKPSVLPPINVKLAVYER